MLYCGIQGVSFGNEGEDYEPFIYYNGWTIPVNEVEEPMFKEFQKLHPEEREYSKEFFKFIHDHPSMVTKLLDKITKKTA